MPTIYLILILLVLAIGIAIPIISMFKKPKDIIDITTTTTTKTPVLTNYVVDEYDCNGLLRANINMYYVGYLISQNWYISENNKIYYVQGTGGRGLEMLSNMIGPYPDYNNIKYHLDC